MHRAALLFALLALGSLPAESVRASDGRYFCETVDGIHYNIGNRGRCFDGDRRVFLPGLHDYFLICIRDPDTNYGVLMERPNQRCIRPDDRAYRCALPNADVVTTNSIESCRQRGGRALGVPPEPTQTQTPG
jgi:hypothetical protein